jgi:hypothetical protein
VLADHIRGDLRPGPTAMATRAWAERSRSASSMAAMRGITLLATPNGLGEDGGDGVMCYKVTPQGSGPATPLAGWEIY